MNSNPIHNRWLRLAAVAKSTKGRSILLGATLALACGCGAPYAVPEKSLADTQAAERSAGELGAGSQPKARLYLQLAHEQLAAANVAIQNGDNERADGLLSRAKADAELAIALTREETAVVDADKATVDSNNQRVTNANQGARP